MEIGPESVRSFLDKLKTPANAGVFNFMSGAPISVCFHLIKALTEETGCPYFP
jgi:hypothetical protein